MENLLNTVLGIRQRLLDNANLVNPVKDIGAEEVEIKREGEKMVRVKSDWEFGISPGDVLKKVNAVGSDILDMIKQ